MRYNVRVQTRASSDRVVRGADRTIKVHLRVPPVDGRANDALREALAEEFGISKSKVRITSGLKSRDKVVEIC